MLCVATGVACVGLAEDSIGIWGNYYKERSTRVVEPMMLLRKDLPRDAQADLFYQMDQITSASGAFTKSDHAFTERRHEARLALRKRWDALTPGLRARYSTEPDYRSLGFGGELTVSPGESTTVVRSFVERDQDTVLRRDSPTFSESLASTSVGVAATRIVRRDLLAGVSVDAAFLRGYQRNPYRSETHPRSRDRFAASAFAAYTYTPTDTTAQLGYRYYVDDWDLVGHTVDAILTQGVGRDLEVVPRFRWYTQNGVYFAVARADDPEHLSTMDPKLKPFHSRLYGVGLRWRLSWLRGTALDGLASSKIEPTYAYLDQTNSYGPAHIAQIGWWWPF